MEGHKQPHEGLGDDYPKSWCHQMQYHICAKDLSAGSLWSHLHTVHGIDGSGSILVDPAATVPCVFKLSFVYLSGYCCQTVPCPLVDFPFIRHMKLLLFSIGISSIAASHPACILGWIILSLISPPLWSVGTAAFSPIRLEKLLKQCLSNLTEGMQTGCCASTGLSIHYQQIVITQDGREI